jgi:threonine dehydratase
MPHIIEVTVKPTRQAMKRFLRPNRAASQPTGAVMIAAITT